MTIPSIAELAATIAAGLAAQRHSVHVGTDAEGDYETESDYADPQWVAERAREIARAIVGDEIEHGEAGDLAAVHLEHGWVQNVPDGDPPRFAHDVRTAKLFATSAGVISYLVAHKLAHPNLPNSHTQAGFTILRVR